MDSYPESDALTEYYAEGLMNLVLAQPSKEEAETQLLKLEILCNNNKNNQRLVDEYNKASFILQLKFGLGFNISLS
jgi:DnaJ-domain-containing protein 1